MKPVRFVSGILLSIFISGIISFIPVPTPVVGADTTAPKVSNLRIKRILVNQKEDKESGLQRAQLVITWRTDENSTSQVEYGQGTLGAYTQATQQNSDYTTDHVVIVSNLKPSQVYRLRVVSFDKEGNKGASPDTVVITPKASESVVDLVINSLKRIFGFLY